MNPFFSLVVPCYNDGRYANGYYLDQLLNSVESQGIDKSQLEVILVDDKSPVSFDAWVKKYSSALNIKVVSLQENRGQAYAREQGALRATGQWLCFADHDDLFYPNALSTVKQSIEANKEQILVYSAFDKVAFDDTNKVIEKFVDPNLDSWIHGKFYNMTNLWKKCDIHFISDMRSHEDIALGALIKCALHGLGLPANYHLYIDKPIYKWVFNPKSKSNSEYVPVYDGLTRHEFHEVSFDMFIRSKIEPIQIGYTRNWLSKDDAITLTLAELLGFWFSLNSFMCANPDNYLKVNEAYCSRELHRIKFDYDLSLTKIKVIVATLLAQPKNKIDSASQNSMLPNTFKWLEQLNIIDYQSEIDKWQTEQSKKSSKVDVSGRPFFSLVIACYNDGRYKKGTYLDRLLDSVTKQGLRHDDIEVILSDDCSPIPYDSIVTKYSNILKIKRTKTDYNCCPGNTRAKGVELVEGQWLCFADHDDIFYDGALGKIKEQLIEKGEQHYAFGDFYAVDLEGNVTHKFEMTMNWCHAKFYNVDNLWKPMGIHFIKDLKSHEDIAICTQVGCALEHLKRRDFTYFHFPVYQWTDNPQSVSHAKYTVDTETGPRNFLEVFFDDYVHSTGYIYIEMFKKRQVSIVYAITRVIEVMLYCYFYTQSFMFKRPDDYYKKNLAHAGDFIRKCKATFNLSNTSICKAIAANEANMYLNIRKQADPGCGHYMPVQTLRYWLELVCESYIED